MQELSLKIGGGCNFGLGRNLGRVQYIGKLELFGHRLHAEATQILFMHAWKWLGGIQIFSPSG